MNPCFGAELEIPQPRRTLRDSPATGVASYPGSDVAVINTFEQRQFLVLPCHDWLLTHGKPLDRRYCQAWTGREASLALFLRTNSFLTCPILVVVYSHDLIHYFLLS